MMDNETTLDNLQEEDIKPPLFSKLSLILYSSFFSLFLGSILYSINLNKVDKKKSIPIVIVLGGIFTFLIFYILYQINFQLYPYQVVVHGVLGIVFYNVLWKRQIGKIKFVKKNVLIPLIVTIVLIFATVVIIEEASF